MTSSQTVDKVGMLGRHGFTVDSCYQCDEIQDENPRLSEFELQQRARAEIRAVAGLMGKDGVLEDAESICMT